MATGCSSKISYYHDPSTFYFDKEINLPQNFCRNVIKGFPVIKILMLIFCFNYARIWIDSNRTLVCFCFYTFFLIIKSIFSVRPFGCWRAISGVKWLRKLLTNLKVTKKFWREIMFICELMYHIKTSKACFYYINEDVGI